MRATALLLSFALATSGAAFAGEATKASPEHDKAGFVTAVEDGRLWVFEAGSKDHEEFLKNGEPVRQFAKVGAGPNGMTVKGPSIEVIDAYLAK